METIDAFMDNSECIAHSRRIQNSFRDRQEQKVNNKAILQALSNPFSLISHFTIAALAAQALLNNTTPPRSATGAELLNEVGGFGAPGGRPQGQ